MRRSSRTVLANLHRWTGLGAGLFFLLVALTGAAMAFRLQLEPVAAPALLTAPACAARLPLDQLVASARQVAAPDAQLKFIRLYDDPGATVRVRFDDGRWVYVDACSGRVTGSEALYSGLFGTLGWLHIFGFAPSSSWIAGGFATLLALAMLGAGAALWWPATMRALRAAIRPPRRLQGRAFSISLHKAVAFYAAPVLLASALTGMMQSFGWGQAPGLKVIAPAADPTAQTAPIETMWRQAQLQVPQPGRTQIRFGAAGAPVTFELVAQSAPHANALGYVRIDSQSGQVLEHTPHASNRAAHKAYLFAAGLHYGWIGGLAGQLLLLLGALAVPVLAWTGTASFLRGRRAPGATRQRLLVAHKTIEAQGVCSFELVAADGGALPRFSAGSHIEVHLPGGLVRHYSLCNDPRERHRYLIAVALAADTRGGSRAMHETVREGDVIETGLPKNHFPLAAGARRTLLFAGGIGITPIICMAEHLAGGDFTLHYFARAPERAAFRERIARSAFAGQANFHFGDGEGAPRLEPGSLLPAPDAGTHLYVCGPAGFMNAVIDAALARGWNDAQIHSEYFAAAPADSAGDSAFEIRIASSGEVVRVEPGVTALAALAARGIRVPSSCEQGVCGTCITRVINGEPDHRDLFLSPAQRACNDQFAPCCSRSRSPVLTLDL